MNIGFESAGGHRVGVYIKQGCAGLITLEIHGSCDSMCIRQSGKDRPQLVGGQFLPKMTPNIDFIRRKLAAGLIENKFVLVGWIGYQCGCAGA
ncbi:hypothetical protein SDC9_204576 [bioreactor metagenome]|uniref:Uncharacterized protein n=1 Tax=bioreactor metagenome TaxID=1076179 RepID=A0A645JBH1_9ZZZZ